MYALLATEVARCGQDVLESVGSLGADNSRDTLLFEPPTAPTYSSTKNM